MRLNSYHAWFNNSLDWWFPGDTVIQSELTDIFGVTFIMSLPISPLPGAVVDFFAGKYRSNGEELKGRKIGVAVVCALCSIFSAALSYLCTIRGSYTISGNLTHMDTILNISFSVICQIMFSVIRTFTYAIHATACFLLFPNNLFGMIFGSMQLCNGFMSLTADPIFRLERIFRVVYLTRSLDPRMTYQNNLRFIHSELDGDYTSVHIALAIACFATIFQPFVVVFYNKAKWLFGITMVHGCPDRLTWTVKQS